jgi:hypothetical protein
MSDQPRDAETPRRLLEILGNTVVSDIVKVVGGHQPRVELLPLQLVTNEFRGNRGWWRLVEPRDDLIARAPQRWPRVAITIPQALILLVRVAGERLRLGGDPQDAQSRQRRTPTFQDCAPRHIRTLHGCLSFSESNRCQGHDSCVDKARTPQCRSMVTSRRTSPQLNVYLWRNSLDRAIEKE